MKDTSLHDKTTCNSTPFTKSLLAAAISSAALFGSQALASAGSACDGQPSGSSITVSSGPEDRCNLSRDSSVTITSAGSISDSIYGVSNDSSGNGAFGTILNEGTITGITNGINIGAEAGGAVTGAIINLGDITATNAINISSFGVELSGGITNSGNLNGNVILQNTDLTITGGAINGTVSGDAGADVIIAGDFTTGGNFINGGNFIVNNGVTLTQQTTIATTVQNQGIFRPAVGAQHAVTHYHQSSSGKLQVDVAGETGNQYSQLFVGGDFIVPSNAKIHVNVIGDPTLTVGGRLEAVVEGDGTGITSDGTFVVTDNSSLYRFQAIIDGDDLDLEILKGLSILDSTIKSNNTPGEGLGGLLDDFADNGTSNADVQAVLDALGELNTEAEISAAVSQLLPLLTGNQQVAASEAINQINRIIQARVEGTTGLSSGDGVDGEHQLAADAYLWVKAFNSQADQDERKGVTGFDADTNGIVMGTDVAINARDRVGIAFSYAETDVDADDNLNSADVTTYQLTAYGSRALDERTQLSLQLGYGHHNTEGDRFVSFMGGRASSDFDSQSLQVGAALQRSFTFNNDLTLVPAIRTDYLWMDNDSYTEKGVSGLAVESNDVESWLFTLESKLLYPLANGIVTYASAGVSYDVINETSQINAAFAGEPGSIFTTEGLEPEATTYHGSLGLTIDTDTGIEVDIRYDFSAREDFDSNTFSAKARWQF